MTFQMKMHRQCGAAFDGNFFAGFGAFVSGKSMFANATVLRENRVQVAGIGAIYARRAQQFLRISK